jgi:hypothetical protein
METPEEIPSTPDELGYSYDSSLDGLDDTVSRLNAFFGSEPKNEILIEQKVEEAEMESISILIGGNRNNDTIDFMKDLSSLNMNDDNFETNLLNLLNEYDDVNNFANNFNNNISDVLKVSEDYDENVQLIKNSANDIITKLENIDFTDKKISDAVEEEIQSKANNLQNDIRLQKLKKLPWSKILGGIFGLSFYTVCVVLITYFIIVSNNSKKQNSLRMLNKNYNNLNIYNNIYLFLLISKMVSGCYMINGKNVVRLDGCSDWYKDPKNMSKCSCKTTETTKCEKDDCDPYCIDTTNCGSAKCTNKLNIALQPCKNKLGNDNFVYYLYQTLPKFSLTLVNKNIKNAILNKNKESKLNLTKIIFIILIILFSLSLIILILKNFFNKV